MAFPSRGVWSTSAQSSSFERLEVEPDPVAIALSHTLEPPAEMGGLLVEQVVDERWGVASRCAENVYELI
jgi:hypothetical protein